MMTTGGKSQKGKIESNKVLLKNLFSDFWFCIPEYQRSYVWTQDEVSELINDITYACNNHPADEYFLGSLVLQKKTVSSRNDGNEFDYTEYDLLDGQQRLTTTLMLLAVLRDATTKAGLKGNCKKYIYQEEDEYEEIPERLRIIYKIRDAVGKFVQVHIKEDGGTLREEELEEFSEVKNVSISNMAKAILYMTEHFSQLSEEEIDRFAKFLFNNVLLIYVSSEDLEDAFRLFTILNDRGLPLTNSDILKAWNLGAVKSETESEKYAIMWEELEGSFGRDEFERLLSIIRTIYVKDKARENILKEFEEKIYKATPPLLSKGKETFEAIKEYAEIYNELVYFEDIPKTISNRFKNLIQIMKAGLPSNDWIPALLSFYKKFGATKLLEFTILLENKFSADWMLQQTPTTRIVNMSTILKLIEKAKTADAVLNATGAFSFDQKELKNRLNDVVYGKRFGKYILLKLDYLYQDHSHVFPDFEQISVEHVLPQNPADDSEWKKIFTDEERTDWTHALANLALISRKKNTSLSRRDFKEKKTVYFNDYISAFPNSLRVMQYDEWSLDVLEKRQVELLDKIMKHYSV
jgi:uncharacterized protein with ParB-like and HNH nuclease domain